MTPQPCQRQYREIPEEFKADDKLLIEPVPVDEALKINREAFKVAVRLHCWLLEGLRL